MNILKTDYFFSNWEMIGLFKNSIDMNAKYINIVDISDCGIMSLYTECDFSEVCTHIAVRVFFYKIFKHWVLKNRLQRKIGCTMNILKTYHFKKMYYYKKAGHYSLSNTTSLSLNLDYVTLNGRSIYACLLFFNINLESVFPEILLDKLQFCLCDEKH